MYGKEAISESTLINEFLVEAFPGRNLALTDPKGWYETQAWGKYLDYNLGPSIATLGWHATMAPLMKERDQKKLQKAVAKIPIKERQAAWAAAIANGYSPEQLADSRRKIELAAKRMEDALANSPWLMGDDYSIIDINAYSLSATLPRLLPDVVNGKATPRLLNWLERVGGRPAVREVMAMRKMSEPQDVYAPGPEHSRWG
jgi:glutathione S-transferase